MTSLPRNLWLLAIVPFAYLVYAVVRYNVPVPYIDEWDLVPDLEKMYNGTLTLNDLWQPHNEHRLLFPKTILLGLARLTHWDIRYEFAANILLAAGIFLVLVLQVKITERKLEAPELSWAIPLFSVIVFSLGQYQNWFWGSQVQIFLSVFGVIGGIVLLANPPFTWSRLLGAAGLGIVASYSFGNGGVFWLVGLLILLVVTDPGKERWLRVAVWLLLASLTIGIYFYHFDTSEYPPWSLFLSEPIQYLSYVFKYLGNICAQYDSFDYSLNAGFALIYGIGGLAVLIWAVVVLRRSKLVGWKTLAPFLAMSLYSIVSAMVVGAGRVVPLGSNQAVSSRYCTITAPFWVSLVALLLILSTKPKSQSKSRPAGRPGAAKWLLCLVSIVLILGSAIAINGAADLGRSQDIGRQLLLTIPAAPAPGGDYYYLLTLYPRPETIVESVPFLREHHLSIFRNEPPVPRPVAR